MRFRTLIVIAMAAFAGTAIAKMQAKKNRFGKPAIKKTGTKPLHHPPPAAHAHPAHHEPSAVDLKMPHHRPAPPKTAPVHHQHPAGHHIDHPPPPPPPHILPRHGTAPLHHGTAMHAGHAVHAEPQHADHMAEHDAMMAEHEAMMAKTAEPDAIMAEPDAIMAEPDVIVAEPEADEGEAAQDPVPADEVPAVEAVEAEAMDDAEGGEIPENDQAAAEAAEAEMDFVEDDEAAVDPGSENEQPAVDGDVSGEHIVDNADPENTPESEEEPETEGNAAADGAGGMTAHDFELSDDDFAVFEQVVKGLGEDFDPSHILTFAVPAGENVCLYEDLTKAELADAKSTGDMMATLTGALFISGGSGRDIFFKILGPRGDMLDNRMLHRETAFVVPLEETGTYELCFGNEMSMYSQKVITVAFHFEKPKPTIDHLKTEDLLPIGASADNIRKTMQSVRKELMFMDHRFVGLHNVQKTMGRRAVWGTLMESCVVLTVAFAQICYIKHIVEKGQPLLGYSGV